MQIIKREDKNYPKQLNYIKKAPEKLYVMGNLKLLDTYSIAIIGSRNCSKEGEKIARKFARELALHGITIVSGLANRNRYSCTYGSFRCWWGYNCGSWERI